MKLNHAQKVLNVKKQANYQKKIDLEIFREYSTIRLEDQGIT